MMTVPAGEAGGGGWGAGGELLPALQVLLSFYSKLMQEIMRL